MRAAVVSSVIAVFGAERPTRQAPLGAPRQSFAQPAVQVSIPALDAAVAGARVSYGLTERRSKISAAIAFEEPEAHYLVVFHSDVSPEDADRVLLDQHIPRIEHPDLMPSQRLVSASEEQIRALSERDEVAYVFPASDELAAGAPVFGCLGPLLDGGPVAQYIATVGAGWDGEGKGAAELTFSIGEVTDRIPRDQVTSIVHRALGEWSRHAAIRVSQTGTPGRPRSLDLLFAHGAHGDAYPFDGRGRVLAHTFYPAGVNPEPLAGDVHFDADEIWSEGGQPDLYSVVLHEIGHALGLGHSDRPGTVMYPYYRMLSTLHPEDVGALQRLYAAATVAPGSNPQTPPQPPPAPEPPPAVKDTTAPTLSVTTPATATSSTSVSTARISGTARDNEGVVSVYWQRGADSGVALGTSSWWFDLPLLRGTNTVIVRAKDAAGNIAWRTVMITRR